MVCIFFISCVNVSYSVIKSVVIVILLNILSTVTLKEAEMNMLHVVSILTEKHFPTVSSGLHR